MHRARTSERLSWLYLVTPLTAPAQHCGDRSLTDNYLLLYTPNIAYWKSHVLLTHRAFPQNNGMHDVMFGCLRPTRFSGALDIGGAPPSTLR